MAEHVQIELARLWDEKTLVQRGDEVWLAEILITFQEFDPPAKDFLGESSPTEGFLLMELYDTIREVAKEHLDEWNAKTEVEIKRGSLVVVLTISVPPMAYKFFKDYEDLRKGVLAFVEDLRKASARLHSVVEKWLGPKKNKDSSSGVSRRGQQRSA